ncbi:hypothetical protein [Clostridium luticellarii]|jgi:hypothetical protein|uniref:Uncharacterized protein n=1 Tax=Clostridium luticellarii TaxID=1691940 RepID=A0A2T0BQL7_9CLOT|nr:hypothetical protein [Clostridium luticellarii]MCI1944803.1 hypothetical protein [Clostridium luticellarii]MCI1968298.1 hypothetical protein [Clostridium luticellarii]MCI1995665.1 hypothetical protein [Clostridium luticellarii]MCI2040255.1 hypothetical protein [Clostridium luticellarii]PRR86173.1 hypothetical protein CLLU_08230 [Clostridium luticellarii]
MENNTGISTNAILINDSLNKAEAVLQDLLLFSLEEIKNNPSSEEKILSLWSESMVDLGNFFFQECERIDNKRLYKRIVRSLIFKH